MASVCDLLALFLQSSRRLLALARHVVVELRRTIMEIMRPLRMAGRMKCRRNAYLCGPSCYMMNEKHLPGREHRLTAKAWPPPTTAPNTGRLFVHILDLALPTGIRE
jgi:hypothetical protein